MVRANMNVVSCEYWKYRLNLAIQNVAVEMKSGEQKATAVCSVCMTCSHQSQSAEVPTPLPLSTEIQDSRLSTIACIPSGDSTSACKYY